MTKFDDIYEEAADHFGLITAARAKELGITNNELVQYARRGRIERIGHGLYQLVKRVPETNDAYAIAVALAGPDAYLFGESVIALHNLAPTNPKRIDVATPKRVRRKLPAHIRLAIGRPESDLAIYDGIPSQSVSAAIRSCKGKLMEDRLVEATKNARREGLIRKREEAAILRELKTDGQTSSESVISMDYEIDVKPDTTESPSIKGWDTNALTDIHGVSILNEWLTSDARERFFPNIDTIDKNPVYDGGILVGEKTASGCMNLKFKIDVQVKSTQQDLTNPNTTANTSKYKFNCDAAIIKSVVNGVSKNPAIIFVVDIPNRRIFRKLLNLRYIEELKMAPEQKSKTLYFDDIDILSSHDRFYEELIVFRRESEAEYDLIRNHKLICPDDITEKKKNELKQLADELNLKCDTDFFFLKEWAFEDTWKIGLLYRESDLGYYLALVAIGNDTESYIPIRSFEVAPKKTMFDMPLGPLVNDDTHFAIHAHHDIPFAESVDKLLAQWAKSFSETWFIPAEAMTDEMLSEVCFFYLDLLASWVPELQRKDGSTAFANDSIAPASFRRHIDAVKYAHEKKWGRYFTGADTLPESAVVLVDTPKAHEPVNEDFSSNVFEYISSGISFEESYQKRIVCKEISFAFLEKVSLEADKRGIALIRPWKLSLRADAVKKLEAYTASPTTHLAPFDFMSTRDDFILNFSNYLSLVGPAKGFAASVFFGQRCERNTERQEGKVVLFIDDYNAVYDIAMMPSDEESWQLSSIRPYEEAGDVDFEDLKQLLHMPEANHMKSGYVPKLIHSLPLYCEVEEFLVNEMNSLMPGENIKLQTRGSNRKRKEGMSYVMSVRTATHNDPHNEEPTDN